MTRRLVILTEIISPYRIPLFNELARCAGIALHVIFLAETDPELRQWKVYKDEIQFSYEVLPSWRARFAGNSVLLNRGVGSALAAAAPDAIVCGGYNYLASWQALAWARDHGTAFLLWSESHTRGSSRPRRVVEFLKEKFLHKCSGFVVPGNAAREYLREHGIKDEIIFTARNAVDNDFFSAGAAEARKNAAMLREKFNLPERYFLFAGRLVREKGVFELLSAYAKLSEPVRRQLGLVFAGDGAAREELQQQAAIPRSSGVIRFAGFAHREELATYYALAEMLILPTYSDTWGLVVNEAMACGLPVILSSAAGCAVDLVKEGWNGLLIPPRDGTLLTTAMDTLARQSELRATMGTNSAQHISLYSPAEWARGIAQAIGTAIGPKGAGA